MLEGTPESQKRASKTDKEDVKRLIPLLIEGNIEET
jgi:hypothetical protein